MPNSNNVNRTDFAIKAAFLEIIQGAVHKRRPQSGNCPVRTFCGQGGEDLSDAKIRTF